MEGEKALRKKRRTRYAGEVLTFVTRTHHLHWKGNTGAGKRNRAAQAFKGLGKRVSKKSNSYLQPPLILVRWGVKVDFVRFSVGCQVRFPEKRCSRLAGATTIIEKPEE